MFILHSNFDLEFKFNSEELNALRGHPMFLTLAGAVAQAKQISAAQAYIEMCDQIKTIANEKGWVNGDEMCFPLNRAYIIVVWGLVCAINVD